MEAADRWLNPPVRQVRDRPRTRRRPRKGAPFEWRQGNNGFWHATDSRGTSWDVGPGSYGVGVTVAEWDRPDWWVDTIEQGKAVAEEVAARPSFPRELWVEEHLIGDI